MEQEKQRTIQEYVPGKQVTLAHLIANPDKDMCGLAKKDYLLKRGCCKLI